MPAAEMTHREFPWEELTAEPSTPVNTDVQNQLIAGGTVAWTEVKV